MTMPDGRVEFEITADGRKAYASIDQITEELRKSGIKWEKDAKTSTDNIFGSFEGMIKKVVGTISAAAIGKMLLNIGKDAIQAASDLEEVQNVVDVTFGDAGAKKIEAWAKAAGDQFGLTETQAKRFTSTLGAMMKSSGMAGDEIVEMSTDLAGLAADMASFYNLDFDTAFQKIRSGISGETEPLKQLGINMSVANLNAFALQKGLSKTFDQMTQGEQTMLRYQYLMQATADAQGDFARTLDGFANSKRQFETNLETLKTNLGGFLLNVVTPVIGGINDLFAALTQEPTRTIVDDINDIDVDTAEQMRQLEETYAKAQSIISLIGEIEQKTVTTNTGETLTLASLFGDMKKIEEDGGDVRAYLQGLGVDVDYVTRQYQVWQKSFEELEKLVPGLTGDILDQSGAIDGTAQALQDNLDAWKANEEKKLAWSAYYAKKRAVEEKKAELYLYEFDAGAARQRAEKARAAIENVWKGIQLDADGEVLNTNDFIMLDSDKWDKLNADLQHYYILLDEQAQKEKELAEQSGSLADVERQLADGEQYLIEKYGEAEEAITETKNATVELTQEQKTAIDNAKKAAEAVIEYRDAVRKATEQSVNSNLGGFSKIKTAAQAAQEAANAYQEFADSLKDSKLSARELEIKLDEANKQITARSMKDALQSQLDFINEYKANLDEIKNTGLIDESIIAQLSDGSEESAQYLHAMAEAARSGDTAALTELNDAWKAVNEGKGKFVDTLTQQKLAVDEQYDAMVAKAEEAAKALDVSGIASQSTGNVITAMAKAIGDHVAEVAQNVNAVLSELNRLNEWGVTIDYGFGASTVIKPGATSGKGGMQIASLAVGADWIPFDGYLAQLHQGEAVLTAEENRIWQAFKNGGRGVDYDQLGGMISGIKPGGDVYLDGRVVGSVVSQMQGNQYRSLQRSGWQQ